MPPRLLRAAARLVLPGLVLAASASPAAAQPACATDALSAYLTPGFACELAGWAFSDFFLSTDAAADGSTSATAPLADGSDIAVTPFLTEIAGTRRWGFMLEGLTVAAHADGGAGLDGTGVARALFGFLGQQGAGGFLPTQGGFDLSVFGATDTPGRTELYQSVLGSIFNQDPPGPAGECATRFVENFGPGDKPRSVLRNCADPGAPALAAVFFLEADAHRHDSPRTAAGTSSADLSLVVLQAVPEPATVALTATGLLALAGVARRRRA